MFHDGEDKAGFVLCNAQKSQDHSRKMASSPILSQALDINLNTQTRNITLTFKNEESLSFLPCSIKEISSKIK